MSLRIEAKGLTKRYGAVRAVDDLTFTVEPGRVTGFLGPNGAGKTTTMRMMLGLDAPASGTVTIGGRPFQNHRAPMGTVGALLDARAAHPGRTAYRHLVCLAESNHIPARRVREVLELVGLAGASRRRAGGLSLGMSQRLGVAAALLGDPPVLIFDEPVNGLDPEGIRWIRTLMRGYATEGRTVLVSSHLMSEMALTADHLIVIGRGRLIADRPLDDFLRDAATPGVLVRTAEPERLTALLGGASVETAADGALIVHGTDAAAVGAVAARHGIALSELSPRRVSLEDAFMNLTAGSLEFTA
ncbi:ABC-2 type transport system ATP-binding protein [Catenuloplanes nepalensis]|uniref:ABC-2 type transport system ATP-binding protein n=1 Tax=Catenuloplanes nepalensis TaxID=587533 RepID=A0ABT9MV68_9ACTN|nr:ATP-binding cassette domain-containing protein [Catenuloplanes nepalensis]MDP9795325.1 ABC-2 type transport system ATP-binding protein [Catenuloplanes nepalensis]